MRNPKEPASKQNALKVFEALELRKTIARVRKSRRTRGKPDPLTFTRVRLLRKIETRRDAAALAYEEDTRKTLITAARIARSMGLDVRSIYR